MGVNFIKNTLFNDWALGVASAPDDWALGPDGSVAQDTSAFKGSYCVKLTNAGAPTYAVTLYQDAVSPGPYGGKRVRFNAMVKCASPSIARISMGYFVPGEADAYHKYSSYHTGSDEWERLEVIFDISTPITGLRFYLRVNSTVSNKTAYFDDVYAVAGLKYIYTQVEPRGFGVQPWGQPEGVDKEFKTKGWGDKRTVYTTDEST